MKELNELVEMAELADSVGNTMDCVNPHDILAIAEAFRALEKNLAEVRQYNLEYAQREVELEQRAEAAEAKLAELAKQEPVAYTDTEELETMRKETYADMFNPCDEYKSDPLWIPLFTRPAPAVSLVELENFALYMADESVKAGNYPDGWQCKASNAAHEYAEACRANILRKIEEAK